MKPMIAHIENANINKTNFVADLNTLGMAIF
jgi:hypothetical protein